MSFSMESDSTSMFRGNNEPGDTAEGCPEGVCIDLLTSPDEETLRQVAQLEVTAWNQKAEPEIIQRRIERLSTELGQLDAEQKGVFVARAGGSIVGVGKVMVWKDSDSWMVYGLAVHADYRRHGVARALLQACADFARRRGAKTMRSETHVGNPVSQAFHEAVGFNNDGRFVAEDGDSKVAFSMPLH